MKNLTIKDIARLSGVSYATVSRALNNQGSILPETKERILKICRQEGYTPNAIARNLVKKNTSTIGVIVPDVSSPFYSELVPCIEEAVSRMGYHTLWCTSFRDFNREEEYFKLLAESRVEGVIICPVGANSNQRVGECSKRLPTVLIGDSLGNQNFNYVTTDNLAGGRMGADYLLELGHRDILFVGMRPGSITRQHRMNGFLQSMEEHGLTGRCLWDNDDTQTSFQAGYSLFTDFVKENNRLPTALFAATDAVALGVLEACEELRIRVPQDISLLGFDNISYSALPKIKLSTIEQQKKDMAEAAVHILFEMLDSSAPKIVYHAILPPVLVERASCIPVTNK